jgi:ATP11 protein
MTYLEDYKANPASAMPYVTLTLFDELIEKKGLVLLRGDVTNNLSPKEATGYVWRLYRNERHRSALAPHAN